MVQEEVSDRKERITSWNTSSQTKTKTTNMKMVSNGSSTCSDTALAKDTLTMTLNKNDRKMCMSRSLDLSIGSVLNTRSVLASLHANPLWAQSITDVIIRHGISSTTNPTTCSTTTMTSLEVIHLFGTLGAICPHMKTFHVIVDASTTGTHPACPPVSFPIAALTALFEQKPGHLVSLKISASIFAYGPEDFVKFEQAIRLGSTSSALKEIRLEFCEPAPGTPSLDPLLQAFAAVPHLEQITLSGTSINHAGHCTGPSLAKLVNNNNNNNNTNMFCKLKTLTIWGGKRQLQVDDICSFVKSLETNATLKELTIHAQGVTPFVGQAMAQCLRVNKTLERLVLNVTDSSCHSASSTSTSSDYVTTTTLFAKALQYDNRTLRMLSLDYTPGEEGSVMMGDSFDYEFHDFQRLDFQNRTTIRRNAHAVSEAFTDMLHCNPVLEVLWMDLRNDEEDEGDEDEDDGEYASEVGHSADKPPSMVFPTTEMDMLLRLNRYGIRQNLFERAETVTFNDWMNALASQNQDLNALFYLVSRNPSLCCCCTSNKRCAKSKSNAVTRASKKRRTTV